jgi:hypothetical protein
MKNHDQLTTGWQVFLYNVRADIKENLLYFGVGLFDPAIKEAKIILEDPDGQTSYEALLPDIYLNSPQSIVRLRNSIPFQKIIKHGQEKS